MKVLFFFQFVGFVGELVHLLELVLFFLFFLLLAFFFIFFRVVTLERRRRSLVFGGAAKSGRSVLGIVVSIRFHKVNTVHWFG